MSSTVVISFDFELGWGVLENDTWKYREGLGVYDRMREDIPILLARLKSLQIPTTWAMVSNLITERESDLNLDHLPDDYRKQVLNFFRTSKTSSRLGLDLIENILNKDNLCEIGSHSATHLYPSHPSIELEHFVADVAQSFDVIDRLIQKPARSFIFPRDQSKFRISLAELRPGLNMRLNPAFASNLGSRPVTRALRGLSSFVTPVPESSVTVGGHGEIYHLGSINFNAIAGRYRGLKSRLLTTRLHKLFRELESDVNHRTYHVWLHPFNLSESELNRELFNKFIERLSDVRDKGQVEIKPMGTLLSFA